MIRSLTGLMAVVCTVVIASDAMGQQIRMDRKVRVNTAPRRPAPQATQGNRSGGGHEMSAYSPYRTHHGGNYRKSHHGGYNNGSYNYAPYNYGLYNYGLYGYRSYGYRSYPRYYGRYGYGYGYGPIFVPQESLFGPSPARRFRY